ncbi:polysaccharide biosynthesis/export family protein [Labrys neptuniae]
MGVLLAIGMTACGILPRMGPSTATIVDGSMPGAGRKDVTSPYAVIDIGENVVSVIGRHQPAGFRRSFGMQGPAPGGALGVGDTVAVSIYEASSGGLFGTGDLNSGLGTKSAQLPPQQIGRNGKITIPFAGQIVAAGRTPSQVSSAIVGALSPKAIEPQVVVSLVQNTSSLISVSGEVGQGGRFPLSLNGDRVLDAIALAGGPRAPARDIYVRLIRGRRSAIAPLTSLLSQPDDNVYVRPGDQVFLYSNPKSFTVLGASGRNANVQFEGNSVSLAEAIGKAGGLDDLRSDASGVFVFRYEDACIYKEIQQATPCSKSAGPRVPLVYRLNLKLPGSLLVSQHFYMSDKDVIYISTAPTAELYKFLQLLGTGVGMAGAGANLSQIGK